MLSHQGFRFVYATAALPYITNTPPLSIFTSDAMLSLTHHLDLPVSILSYQGFRFAYETAAVAHVHEHIVPCR